jgi:hypothetical protein
MRLAKKTVVMLAVMMLLSAVSVYAAGGALAEGGSITYEPGEGPGGGKHIVFVCGEWEYRCEESLPMMAKILAERHGFKCTVHVRRKHHHTHAVHWRRKGLESADHPLRADVPGDEASGPRNPARGIPQRTPPHQTAYLSEGPA